jgi:hypothetical protein
VEPRSLLPRHLPLAALTVVVIAAGCGSGSRQAETVQSAPPAMTTVTAPTTTASQATTAVHTAPPRNGPKSVPGFASCEGFVEALVETTSCDFANNVFWTFYEARPEQVFPVYSPATGKSYEVTCGGDFVVTCTGGAGAKVRFPMSAVEGYTERDATAYADSHDLGPEQSAQPETNPVPEATTVTRTEQVPVGQSYDEVWNRCFIAGESKVDEHGGPGVIPGYTFDDLAADCRQLAESVATRR